MENNAQNSAALLDSLTSVSPAAARNMNFLLDPSRALRLVVGDETWTVNFCVLDVALASMSACSAELEWNAARAHISVESFQFSTPLQSMIGDCPLPERLPESLLGAILARTIEAVSPDENLHLMSAAYVADSTRNTEFPIAVGFVVTGTNGETSRGLMQCDTDFATALAAQLTTLDEQQTAPESLPIIGTLQLRSVQLDSEIFADLEPTDFILCGRYGQGGPPVLRVYFGPGAYYFARLEGDTLTMEAKEPETSATDETEKAKQAPVDFSKIPVRISFELGQVTLTLAELNSIAAGTTLELPAPVDSPIIIKANGAQVGTGALVRVEDHLGVRILEWTKNS